MLIEHQSTSDTKILRLYTVQRAVTLYLKPMGITVALVFTPVLK